MALSKLFGRWLRHAAGSDGGDDGGTGESRPTPAEINAQRNRDRLARIEEIGRGVDGRRSSEMADVDGDRVTGRFQGGEFDDSPEARERAAVLEEEQAAAALEEQRRRSEEDADEESARRLQAEGASDAGEDGGAPDEGDNGTARSRSAADSSGEDPDEKVVAGVRYYRTILAGQEKWLTSKQLREIATRTGETEETLQRAQDALRSAAHADLGHPQGSAEVPDEKDLENIVLSASMGDEEAVKKLVSVLRTRPSGPSASEVSQLVSQQIATQRAIDQAEEQQRDILNDKVLGPVFRQRLRDFAQKSPNTRIDAAYSQVGSEMRKDFATMLPKGNPRPNGRGPVTGSKADRKQTIVNPPQGAGRQARRDDDDREVPVSEQIDAIAKARGQERAHRQRRS